MSKPFSWVAGTLTRWREKAEKRRELDDAFAAEPRVTFPVLMPLRNTGIGEGSAICITTGVQAVPISMTTQRIAKARVLPFSWSVALEDSHQMPYRVAPYEGGLVYDGVFNQIGKGGSVLFLQPDTKYGDRETHGNIICAVNKQKEWVVISTLSYEQARDLVNKAKADTAARSVIAQRPGAGNGSDLSALPPAVL